MSELFDNAKLYFAKAESKLESAKLNLSHDQYDDAVSRAYYSVNHEYLNLSCGFDRKNLKGIEL
jgi:uncharacterized protein (UPF0332 family)